MAATVILSVLYYVLQVFILMMWIRLILDFVRSARPGWRPPRVLLIVFSIIIGITNPPLKVVRKVVRPARFGNVSIDFAWTIVLIVALIASNVVAGFITA